MKKFLAFLIVTFFGVSINSFCQDCNGTFTDAGGSNGNYVNNSNQTTVICPSVAGQVIEATFIEFAIEATFDGLYVYNGNSTASPQIASTNPASSVPGGLAGAFWGTTIPGPFTSSSPDGCLTFVFRSDGSVNNSGWTANYTCVTATTCPFPTAVVVSSITTTSAVVGWQNNSAATSWEVVVLPCGAPTPTATTSGILTTTNPFIISGLNPLTCYDVYVKGICSQTDSSSWSARATFTTTEAPLECGGNFTDNGGTTNNYLNNTNSTTTICPIIAGNQVTVTFTSFNTETNWDALYIFDGNSITSPQILSSFPAGNVPGNLAGGFWGTTIPGPFTSSSSDGCLTFRFRSDNSVTNSGWTADVTCLPPPTCPKPTTLTTTAITTDSVTLAWTNNSTATSWEVVALPCNTNPTVNTTGIITTLNPYTFSGLTAASCYNLFVRAICSETDTSYWSLGTTATTMTLPPVCGGNFIDNGNISANYLNNSDVTTTICPAIIGETVTVSFNEFDVQAINDGLYVYNGNSINSPQITSSNPSGNIPGGLAGAYWGNSIPGPFTSSSPDGCLTFRFRSGATVNNIGWKSNVTCGPTPDSILLIAFVDQDVDGIKDEGEISFSNGSFVYDINNSGNPTNGYSPNGYYNLYDTNATNSYNFNYEVQPEFSTFYNAGTTSFSAISITAGSGLQVFYFPIVVSQTYSDVTVSIVPISPPRPGLSYINKITYTNLGITSTSGTIEFAKPPQVAITTIGQTGTMTNISGFTYNFTNLLPNETRSINVTMTVPSSPTVNLNDLLIATANITSTSSDINLENNSFSNTQIVVNSFDPNDKKESHGDKIVFSQFDENDYLYYTVRFQNNGTANAIDIRIEDVLNSKINSESIRMVSSSHNYTLSRNNNILNWEFKDIQLVPSSVNQTLSSGYVLFKVKLNAGFTAGDIIPNTASIYFDTNPPIVTNTFNTKFITILSNPQIELTDLLIFPNPANSSVQISSESTKIGNIALFDVLGKNIKIMSNILSNQTSIDVSSLSKGIYLLEITLENNVKGIRKLVIQ